MRLPSSAEVRGCARLAVTGGLVGPVVDGIHNQALLEYDAFPFEAFGLRSSLLVPPLLALAYPILGFALPKLLDASPRDDARARRAVAAVASTTLIVKLSEAVVGDGLVGVALVALSALLQWALLDRSATSFKVALLAAIFGPLAELPFLASGAWHYLSPDYFPLPDYGLNLITGPCYFAVTTDAIALARFFVGLDDDGVGGQEARRRCSSKGLASSE
mmetsp:Transcript_17952/g.54920  ORF Transcript_17952/g.54920 Transcript_17952/m.54920 type:complete len:218 (+) Transcript_17952:88-741(+)